MKTHLLYRLRLEKFGVIEQKPDATEEKPQKLSVPKKPFSKSASESRLNISNVETFVDGKKVRKKREVSNSPSPSR